MLPGRRLRATCSWPFGRAGFRPVRAVRRVRPIRRVRVRPVRLVRPIRPVRSWSRQLWPIGDEACDPFQPPARAGEFFPGGQRLGRRPHPVEGLHPGLADYRAHERGTLLVLAHLQVNAEDAPDGLLNPVARGTPGVELGPDLLDGRYDSWPDGIHNVVAVPLDESHDGGQPVEYLALALALDGLDQARAVAAANGSADGVGGRPEPVQDRRRVKIGGEQELGRLQ